MAQAGVIRDFLVALGFKTDNSGLGKMQDAMKGVELKAKALNGALMALATGAAIAVRQTASELDKLYFSSQRIGASVTNINAYGNAISQLGGNAEGAIGSLESLAEKMRNSPGYEGQINSLGVQTKDANGVMRDRVEVMKDLSGVLAKMPAYQANAYASSLGIDQNTLLAMRDGKFISNMDKYQKIQKELGMNDDLAKSGNEFMTEYRDLTMMTKTGFQVIVMQAGKGLIPVLKLLNQMIQGGIHAFSQLNPHIKEGLTIGLRYALLAVILGGFIRTFGMLFKFIPMLKGFIGLLRILQLTFLASPIGIILALAAALAVLYDDYKTWRAGGKSLFDWSKWTNGIDTIIGKIKEFLEMLDKVKDRVVNFIQKVISDPIGAVGEVIETAKEVAKDTVAKVTSPSSEPASPAVKAVNDVSKSIVDTVKEGAKKATEAVVGVAKAVQGEVKQTMKVSNSSFSHFIGKGEGGYNSVNLGKKYGYKASTRKLTSMTVQQVYDMQKRREVNAVGKFQIIRDTMPEVIKGMGLTGKEKFDEEMQEKMGAWLLFNKRKKLGDYLKGKHSDLKRAGDEGAREWASLPVLSDKLETKAGKKTYHSKRGSTAYSDGVNKAGHSAQSYEKVLLDSRKIYQESIKAGMTEEQARIAAFKGYVAKPKAPQQSNANVVKTPDIKNNAPPIGNPEKTHVNNTNSNITASNVTIHQEFKTDMVLHGVKDPIDSANAVKRQQENALVFMARGAQSTMV